MTNRKRDQNCHSNGHGHIFDQHGVCVTCGHYNSRWEADDCNVSVGSIATDSAIYGTGETAQFAKGIAE